MSNKKCFHNLFCYNDKCRFVHTSEYEFRIFFKEIIDKYKNPNYYTSENKCFYPITCRNPNCYKDHLLNRELSKFIDTIITQKIDIKVAKEMYYKFSQIESDILDIVDEPTNFQYSEESKEQQQQLMLTALMNCKNNIITILYQQQTKDLEIKRLINTKKQYEQEIMNYRSKIEELTNFIIKLNNY